MSRQHHELKTDSLYYQMVENGVKSFELRKNDRDFHQFDMVTLVEVVSGIPTGRKMTPKEIKLVLKGEAAREYGLKKGYCIIQL